jgi:hypothetical protein
MWVPCVKNVMEKEKQVLHGAWVLGKRFLLQFYRVYFIKSTEESVCVCNILCCVCSGVLAAESEIEYKDW